MRLLIAVTLLFQHAVQVLVLAALLLGAGAAPVTWLRGERVRAQRTGVVILGYAGVLVITAWQAIGGQSLVQPDAATWTAAAATLVVTALVVERARRRAAAGCAPPAAGSPAGARVG